MKRILFLLLTVTLSVSLQAQVMRAEELEKYAKERYGEKWTECAMATTSPTLYFGRICPPSIIRSSSSYIHISVTSPEGLLHTKYPATFTPLNFKG